MFKKLPKENMGSSNLGWLESRFHFSFAEYTNRNNMNFGILRVLNDDIIHPQSGFSMHPHRDMEIISYVVKGEITHKDSMGNEETLKSGEVQYMSAGTGVMHSEHNLHETEDLRLLQIWILPPTKNLTPLYGSYRFQKDESKNRFLNIVSSQNGDAKIKIRQDANIYVGKLDSGKSLDFDLEDDRQIYFVQIEGSSSINGIILNDGDAMEIVDERNIDIHALKDSHFLFIEMRREE
jgi:redox-sensitive bicupin YhaK (pirin superfamily)